MELSGWVRVTSLYYHGKCIFFIETSSARSWFAVIEPDDQSEGMSNLLILVVGVFDKVGMEAHATVENSGTLSGNDVAGCGWIYSDRRYVNEGSSKGRRDDIL